MTTYFVHQRACETGLDVCFTLCPTAKWIESWGGYVVYMDETEENEEKTSDITQHSYNKENHRE